MSDPDASATLDAMLRAARALPSGERAAWIDRACGSDPVLRARLEERLRIGEEVTEQWRPPFSAEELRGARPLEPGQRLGRYEIRGLLGAGGMGHVYLALDTALDREVAIKALAHTFHGDALSLRRFEREARMLAALSHPNIAAIYGFERLDGAPYLILERVEGDTLAERLRQGPLPLRQALDVALQVAAGLEEAHGKGVVHRDLKPSNVMLAPGGRVKLVDFGLAKTAPVRGEGADVRGSAAAAEPTTVAGTILGTVPYMSPEQIQGEDIDTRTDVWAFGCLLFEMLSGEPAFRGRSMPELLAAVLRDEPRWEALPPAVPHPVVRLVQRCLAKDPHQRLQHLGDARLELAELAVSGAVAAPVVRRSSPGPEPRWRRALPWAVAALAIGALAATPLWRSPWEPEPRPLRLSLELPAGLELSRAYPPPLAIAPAGTPLALVAASADGDRLYLRDLGALLPRALAGTEGARQPFFSPDGSWVAFFADRKLSKLPAGGGAVVALAEIGNNPRGATWASDGTVVVSPSQTSGLYRLAAEGGDLEPLTTLDTAAGEVSHRWPEAVPGTSWVLFTVGYEDATFDEAAVAAVSLATGERRPLVADASFGRVVPGGPLLFVRAGRLYAVAVDPATLEVRGTPEALPDTLRYDSRNGAAHLAVAASGAVVYGPGAPASPDLFLSWLGRDGAMERMVETPRLFRDPRVAPDGSRAAVVIGTARSSDLWVVDANGTLSQLSFGLAPHRPTWAPDGRGVTVGSGAGGTWRLLTLPADGGEAVELLRSGLRVYPNAWHPDGKRLVFQESRPDTGWDLRVLAIGADGRGTVAPEPLAATPFAENNASLSRDGRWVAYESDEVDAVVQVYVRSFPDGRHKLRVSSGGARGPVWGHDGALYYWDSGRQQLARAALQPAGEALAVAAEEALLAGEPVASPALARLTIHTGWGRLDAHPLDGRFLALESGATAGPPALEGPVVVLDWARR